MALKYVEIYNCLNDDLKTTTPQIELIIPNVLGRLHKVIANFDGEKFIVVKNNPNYRKKIRLHADRLGLVQRGNHFYYK
jgi:hypothetical protein